MTAKKIAELIEQISEELVIARLGHKPDCWYTGGSEHNDYRLFARTEHRDRIVVSDSCGGSEIVAVSDLPDTVAIRAYVVEWLGTLFVE